MIQRLTPSIGYLDASRLNRSGAAQIVIAGGLVHWSGILAARSGANGIEFPADDMRRQLEFVLGVLDSCLAAGGSDRHHLVAVTIYTTDLPALGQAMDTFATWVGEDRPAVTTIGVDRLAFPQTFLELQGCALQASQ